MKKAFTLIELLIVIAVIAILISIALPRFRGMQEEAFTAKAAGELRSLAVAVESYYIHNSNAYPVALSNAASAAPSIVSSVPNDPFNPGTAYGYDVSASPGDYWIIWSYGPDGAADITGIDTDGTLLTAADDDIYISNGTSGTGGF